MQTNRQQLFQNSNPHDVESLKRKYKSVVESCLFLQCQFNAACVVGEHDRKYILLVLPNKASVQILTISGTHAHAFMFRCVLSVLGEISRIISVADPVRQGGGIKSYFQVEMPSKVSKYVVRVWGLLMGHKKLQGFWCSNMHSSTFWTPFFFHFWHLVQHQKLIKIEHYIVLQSIWDIFML